MVSAIIKHEVRDFKKWKKAFDSLSEFRRKSGEMWARVYRSVDNPKEITVYKEWANEKDLHKFFESEELKAAMKDGGVASKPRIEIIESAEIASKSKIVHFEIPAGDIGRAGKFYENVFGWKVSKWDGPMDYWMVKTAEGISGGMMKRQSPIMNVANTIEVNSVDKMCSLISKNGGKCITPKQAIPNVGYMAYFQDTEGNVSGLMEHDMKAK